MKYYDYKTFIKDIRDLKKDLKNYKPDAILAIARGGLSIAQFLSEALNIREVYSINSILYENEHKLKNIKIFNIPDLSSKKTVLIVDDIADSGETLTKITKLLNSKFLYTEFKTATIFYKKESKFKPDYKIRETKEWIEFFWEKDVLG